MEMRKHQPESLQLRLMIKGFRGIFAKELKKARIKKSLSQMELSFIIGCDQNYISRLENGKINASIDTLLKLSYYLDLWIKFEEKNV